MIGTTVFFDTARTGGYIGHMEKLTNTPADNETLLQEAAALRSETVLDKDAPEELVLCFRFGIEHFAIRMEQVREIAEKTEIFKIPGAEEHILGVVNLHGEIIPVIDPRKRVNLQHAGANSKFQLIITKGFGEPLGMAVDEVEDIISGEIVASEDPDSFLEGKISLFEGSQHPIGVFNLKRLFYNE
jgi:chemotaxis signal transduction protein